MAATIIDGKRIAEELRRHVQQAVVSLSQHLLRPGLAVILVGHNPASQVYVRNKTKKTTEAGMASFEHLLPEETSELELLALIRSLNEDDKVDGILVQLPLPGHIDTQKILESISPEKDVDGFHPINVGRVTTGLEALVPCTPYGCLALIKSVTPALSGLDAIIIGRSNIVGKPMAQLLIAENCTVTIAHSRTRNLAEACRRADILVAAAGRPEMVRGDWIKPGAIVIDVGINRIANPQLGEGKTKLVGDVAFEEAKAIAGYITPVPGGVGPMTIACLLRNTVIAACRRRGIPAPKI